MSNDNRRDADSPLHTERRPALHDRLLWLCASVGAVAAVVVLFLFGWSFWTAITVAILIACPAVVAWALHAQRGAKVSKSRNMQ